MTIELNDAIEILRRPKFIEEMNECLGPDWLFDETSTEEYDWGWVLFYRTERPTHNRTVFAWAIERNEGRAMYIGKRGLKYSLRFLLDDPSPSLTPIGS